MPEKLCRECGANKGQAMLFACLHCYGLPLFCSAHLYEHNHVRTVGELMEGEGMFASRSA